MSRFIKFILICFLIITTAGFLDQNLDSFNTVMPGLILESKAEAQTKSKRRPRRRKKTKKRKYRKKSKFIKAKVPDPIPANLIPKRERIFRAYSNLLKKAQNNIGAIKTIRGTLIKREMVKRELLSQEIIEFTGDKNNLYMQWISGYNYKRRILCKRESSKYHIWVREPFGIWKKINFFNLDLSEGYQYLGSPYFFPWAQKPGIWFENIITLILKEMTLWENDASLKLVAIKRDIENSFSTFALDITFPSKNLKKMGRDNLFFGTLHASPRDFVKIRLKIWLRENGLIPVKIVAIGINKSEMESTLALYEFKELEINPEIHANELDMTIFGW